jgi:hypothetical protein
LGERLWREGYRWVLAPTAARREQVVLYLFRETDELLAATPRRPPVVPSRMTSSAVREAITAANTDAAANGCPAGDAGLNPRQ